MRAKKDKGPLRNFYFLRPADEALVFRSRETGRDMVVILEDLILDRRQFNPIVEQFLAKEAKALGLSRQKVIDALLLDLALKKGAVIRNCASMAIPPINPPG